MFMYSRSRTGGCWHTALGIRVHASFFLQDIIPMSQLVRETAAVMQEFTQSGYGFRRPLIPLDKLPSCCSRDIAAEYSQSVGFHNRT